MSCCAILYTEDGPAYTPHEQALSRHSFSFDYIHIETSEKDELYRSRISLVAEYEDLSDL